ncbi:KUP/HAK/KT family potassium transporter [Legionella sp. PATHC032]|uniref:potassium transporter Kup n=1 Tax=Legionella sp. PATHC032 TaxID=2992039 RepID=UPI001B15E3A2|nr:KUP/HAK/KT family potassium transporter [Legionella sp. PATHC032]MCW8422337.1 KUP/HAK/KT family potassium transporter [Legionella sp. PATHC032]HAZ7574234.1 KUP/HAK/KT family potassium transporter [Legionella pneumophila]HBA1635800.1 KUP/HAK/KT family potassium transporter [Legionella pneumophila]
MPSTKKIEKHNDSNPALRALSLSALGIVYGDIGTSPLYTFKTVILLTGGRTPDVNTIMGSVSLIIWTLIIIASFKYICFALRIDNDGEGGVLALMSLLSLKLKQRPFIIAVGLMGAALIYGDGTITPAISVLSAVEGLKILSPSLKYYVLPIAITILIILFAIQSKGTTTIGKAFGPVMAFWFLIIGILGARGVIQHPSILAAINPIYGLSFLFSNGATGFFILCGVFLCVTGAEALYADLGHFGTAPIRCAWFGFVFPSLIFNYLGQAALVLEGASTEHNIFYMLCPSDFLLPLIILSTVATIIASQAIITGAFSMTRQAMQLGWLPRLRVTQTSSEGYGQIYIGVVNWLLMLATLGLTIGFGSSEKLAAAYGIAVSATMLCTTILLFIALHKLWKWSIIKSGLVAGLFLVVDASFFAANLTKFANGGYIPITLAVIIYSIMYIWHKGYKTVAIKQKEKNITIDSFLESIQTEGIVRVAKTAVFLTSKDQDIPPILVWHVKKNRVLQDKVIILKVNNLSIPWCKSDDQLQIMEVATGIWRAVANYGFMEHPNIPKLLKKLQTQGFDINVKDITYYIGHETIVIRNNSNTLLKYIKTLFVFMHRNALPMSNYFHLPPESVFEIGRQIEI